ncbi:MAG: hypothetical protein JST75_18180 [Bacteroidetes bacterium]|nr:hypothetical protein [Bacteroidota bacterium]
MRIFKLILVSIVILCIAVLFVFSLFPSHIRISRVLNIHASREKIHGVINDFNTWISWNEFTNQPNIHKTISTPSAGAGAYIESDEMQIKILTSSLDSIKTVWIQKDRKQIEGGFNIVQTQDSSIVEWYFNFHFKWYPWEKLGSMFYDKQLGPTMEKSLMNLKRYSENP